MPTHEFICNYCGCVFTLSADYFVSGVYGVLNGKTIVDPTEHHTCPKCIGSFLDDLLHITKGEES